MNYFNMSQAQYSEYVKRKSPNSPTALDTLKAFLVGGLICCVGQGIYNAFSLLELTEALTGTLECVTLIFIGALLTGFGVYGKLSQFGGAGTLVPITGFANAVVAPALEFKTEGLVLGTAAKMFTIAGPVIVYGTAASVVYGIILVIIGW